MLLNFSRIGFNSMLVLNLLVVILLTLVEKGVLFYIVRFEIVKSDERYKIWFIGFIVCILFCIFGLIFSVLSVLDRLTVGVT